MSQEDKNHETPETPLVSLSEVPLPKPKRKIKRENNVNGHLHDHGNPVPVLPANQGVTISANPKGTGKSRKKAKQYTQAVGTPYTLIDPSSAAVVQSTHMVQLPPRSAAAVQATGIVQIPTKPIISHDGMSKHAVGTPYILIDQGSVAAVQSTEMMQIATKPIIWNDGMSKTVQDVDDKDKMLNYNWRELWEYEQRFYRDFATFLALKEALLQYLKIKESSSEYARWNAFFNLYLPFTAASSYVFTIGKDPEKQILSEKNISGVISELAGVICKNVCYLDKIATACSIVNNFQTEINQLIQDYIEQLSSTNLGELMTAQMIKNLEAYFNFDTQILHMGLGEFLKRVGILPTQWMTKQKLLYDGLVKAAGNYPSQQAELQAIQTRIHGIAGAVDGTVGTGLTYSMLRPQYNPPPITEPKSTLMAKQLEIGVAIIFQITAYYRTVETNKDNKSDRLFQALLNKTKHLFIVRKVPNAGDELIKILEQIKSLSLSSEMLELIGWCLEILNSKFQNLDNIHVLLKAKLLGIAKIETEKDAYFYTCRALIQEVIDGVEASKAHDRAKMTLPRATRFQAMTELFSSLDSPRWILPDICLVSFVTKLKIFLFFDYNQLNTIINHMKPPFMNNVVDLMVNTWAESSQYTGTALNFMKMKLSKNLLVLVNLQKVTHSFKGSGHQVIMEKYLEEHYIEKNLNKNLPPVTDKNFLCVFNILHLINRGFDYSHSRTDILNAKLIALKLCFQLKDQVGFSANLDNLCAEDLDALKLVLPKITSYILPQQTGLIETLHNLIEGKLEAQGTTNNFFLRDIAMQDIILYLYRTIIQQSNRFLISYMHSVDNDPIEKREIQTAGQKFAIFCCSQFQSLYELDFKQMEKLINDLDNKSIHSLILQEFEKWQLRPEFVKSKASIKADERLMQAITEFKGFMAELDTFINPASTLGTESPAAAAISLLQ